MPPAQPVVLSIAGFDPSSGAGVTADIKTLAAHGCYGVGCVTALTVQSTTGITEVQPVSGKIVQETLRELAADFSIAAIRIGMLGSGEAVEAVVKFLKSAARGNVVLDPVFKSSSGTQLLDDAAINLLKKSLLPLATVITPNVFEATALTGLTVGNLAEMKTAAGKLHALGAKNIVVTGGDVTGDKPEKAIDLLSMENGNGAFNQSEFASDRVRSNSTHGTGCAFATAVAANLALGKQLHDAVVMAKAYVKNAISKAYPLGKGQGPLNHLYRLEEQPRPVQDSFTATREH